MNRRHDRLKSPSTFWPVGKGYAQSRFFCAFSLGVGARQQLILDQLDELYSSLYVDEDQQLIEFKLG